MAKRSRVVVDETIIANNNVETLEDSNVTVDSLDSDQFWERVKMANFRFAMREFCNGTEQGTALSWRGLVCKLLAFKNEGSSKQVFVTVFESDNNKYTITLRRRVILSDQGIGYSLCSLLEHLSDKQPVGVFVRIDIRDTLEVGEVLNLLRERFPNKNKS